MTTEALPSSNASRRVRAIIVSHNTSALTEKCVRSIALQGYSALDLVVVDACSGVDERQKLLGLTNSGVTVILSKERVGYAASLNLGVRAQGLGTPAFILALNSDIEFCEAGSIENLIECLETNPLRVAVSPIINNVHARGDSRSETQVRRLPSAIQLVVLHSWWLRRLTRSKKLSSWFTYADQRPYTRKNSLECEAINGACFMIRAEFLDDIGHFDQGTFLYMEEFVLGAQIREAGRIACLAADVTVDHLQGQSTGLTKSRFRAQMFAEQVRSEMHFLRVYEKAGILLLALLLCVRLIDGASKFAAYGLWHLVASPTEPRH